MKSYRKKDLIKLYEYATRDGFMYARAYSGSGYGKFISDLQEAFKKGEVSLDEAMDRVSNFMPGDFHDDHSPPPDNL